MIKLGIIGEHLSHSLSPKIHMDLLESSNIDGTYDVIEIPQEDFAAAFTDLKGKGYNGLNVTIPYKEAVIPLLDELSPEAKYIGAVNTILFRDGKSIGYNTDYYGFKALINQNKVDIKGKEAVILGGGGAAKATIKVLLDMGIFDITIVSHSKQNFHSQYTISYEYFKESKQHYDVLINCTPVGMFPDIDAAPIAKDLINSPIVIDLIYNPVKTLLLKYAEELGCKTINGEVMLAEQAKESQKIWLSL